MPNACDGRLETGCTPRSKSASVVQNHLDTFAGVPGLLNPANVASWDLSPPAAKP